MTKSSMYKAICKYIQEGDKNSDIMDAYKEYETGEIPFDVLHEICYNVLVDWKEDIFEYGTPTVREIAYYEFMGI